MQIWENAELISGHIYKLEVSNGNIVLTKADKVPENIIELPDGSFNLQYGENVLEGIFFAEGKNFLEYSMEINTVLCDDNEFYCLLNEEIEHGGAKELKKVTWCNDDNMYDVIFA